MRGRRAENLNNDIVRMVTAAQKYDANLAAIRLTPQLKSLLPAWYHIAANPRPITNIKSKCLLNTHETTRVADLIQMSARLRETQRDRTHLNRPQCICRDCVRDRQKGCKNPHACAVEALIRCSTGCTRIPTGAENRSGGDRAERTPTTERVGGIPLPNQIRAETPGMHQTKPHPRSSPCASKQRRCRDARSVQDEDRGQGRLRIDRNSYLEVQDGPGSQRSGQTDRRRRK